MPRELPCLKADRPVSRCHATKVRNKARPCAGFGGTDHRESKAGQEAEFRAPKLRIDADELDAYRLRKRKSSRIKSASAVVMGI